jgi:hypothetical protein
MTTDRASTPTSDPPLEDGADIVAKGQRVIAEGERLIAQARDAVRRFDEFWAAQEVDPKQCAQWLKENAADPHLQALQQQAQALIAQAQAEAERDRMHAKKAVPRRAIGRINRI